MLGLSVVDGVLLGLLSIPSFIVFAEYARYGELAVPFEAEVCAYIFGPVLILLTAPVMLLAWSLSDRARSDASRRAVYVLSILPVVVWVYMFASFTEGFVPSLLLGMPLFILSAIAIPFSSFILHREVMTTLVSPYAAHIHCRMCGAHLMMAREDPYVQCRRCTAINANPFLKRTADGAVMSPPPASEVGGYPEYKG